MYFCPFRVSKAESLRAKVVEPWSGVLLLFLLCFFIPGCDNTNGIFNSQAGPTRAQVNNVAIDSDQLTNGQMGTVQLTLTAHRTSGKNCFGSGHIQKSEDASFYSEFGLTSFEVNDRIRLKAEITKSNTADFVGLILEIEAQDLGKGQEDQVLLKFDIQQELSSGLIEFSGPGLVQTAP